MDQGTAFAAQPGRASAIETGTKLYISNLEYGVSNEDIKVLLSHMSMLLYEVQIFLPNLILFPASDLNQ